MNLSNILFVLCSAASPILTKPYSYSYYLSLPGHYQSLEVKDGALILNNVPALAGNPVPDFRQGRVDPVFNPNPGLDRRFPVNPGIPADPNFRPGGLNPGFSQNPRFDGRYPIIPGNQGDPNYNQRGLNPNFNQRGLNPNFNQRGFNPNFNQYPSLGRRNPDQNGPDFGSGRYDPDIEEIPDGEVDSQYNPNRPFPLNPNRPDFRNGRFNPDDISNGDLDPQFNRGGSNSPEFGNRIRPLIPRRRGISRRTLKPQEKEENDDKDREEVTTQNPCLFCGVNKINPMDDFDGDNVNPDSESVEPTNVGGTADPEFVIQNNVGTPPSVGVPGYLFNNPFVTYYATASL